MDNKKLRNSIWIIVGIILMVVVVVATTTISDTEITTTGNLNIDGNITFDNAPLHFESNGNSLLFINQSDGNVGIGTINPTNKIHVVTAGNPARFESTSGNGRIEIDSPSTKNAGVQFFENNTLRWGIFNQGTDDSLKFQNKDFATRLVVEQDGNVGIGTTAPQYKLEIVGNVSLNNTLFVTTGGNVGIGTSSPVTQLHVGAEDSGGPYFIKISGAGTGSTEGGELTLDLAADHDGVFNSWNIDVFEDDMRFLEGSTERWRWRAGGDACDSGTDQDFTDCTSDARLKTDVTEYQYGLDEILGLNPVNFYWNEEARSRGYPDIKVKGLIAQEVEKIIPEWVGTNEEGYKHIPGQGELPLALIKAIQEQQSQIEELKAENNLLKDRLTQIEERLNSMDLICSN